MLSSYRKSRHSVHCRHGINVPRPCLVILDSLAPLSDAVLKEGKASSRDNYLRYRTSTHDVLRTASDVLSTIPAMPSNSIEPMSKVEHTAESWAGVGTGARQGSIGRWRSNVTASHMLAVRDRISEPNCIGRWTSLVCHSYTTEQLKVNVVMTSETRGQDCGGRTWKGFTAHLRVLLITTILPKRQHLDKFSFRPSWARHVSSSRSNNRLATQPLSGYIQVRANVLNTQGDTTLTQHALSTVRADQTEGTAHRTLNLKLDKNMWEKLLDLGLWLQTVNKFMHI